MDKALIVALVGSVASIVATLVALIGSIMRVRQRNPVEYRRKKTEEAAIVLGNLTVEERKTALKELEDTLRLRD